MIIRAQTEVLESARWLTAEQVAELANLSTVGSKSGFRSIKELADWFASANGFLGGRRPQVVAAAKDETSGVRHG